jgi:subtilase family serine protease
VRKAPVLVLALALAGGVAAVLPASAATDGRSAVPQSHPDWATSSAKVADSAPNQALTFRVYLTPQDESGAEATAQAVSDPRNSSFRHYLTPAQVAAEYAPSGSSVNAVRGWLSSAGFTVGAVPSNNAYLQASGTVNQVDGAFGTHLGEYRVSGKTLRAPAGDLSVPASVASDVLGVIGVDQAENLMKPDLTTGAADSAPADVPPPAGFRNAQPCSAYYGQKTDTTDPAFDGQQLSYAPCGYTPEQLRSASGLSQVVQKGVDGHGTTVAIVDAFGSPTLYADAAEYAKRNDPAHPLAKSQFSEIVSPPTPGSEAPDQCDAAGWYGEQTLDVEAVHAMAPGAHILFVGAADCQDLTLDSALNTVVAGHLAGIVSNSYGDDGEDLPASEIQAFHQIAVQAVLEGIGLYFSSGDNGDEAAVDGHPEADFSATDPWVTAVGGTSLGIGANGKKVMETGWETGVSTQSNGAWTTPAYDYGSGGGTSVLFREPFYQKGIVPDALAAENQTGTNRGRVVPDISMDADPNTGFLVGETQTFPDGAYYDQYRIGGTSLASPLFAGVMADADQLDGFSHGFINPALYLLTSRTPAITDVAPTSATGVVRVDYVDGTDAKQGYKTTVRTLNDNSLTIHTTKGYDNVTGLGTPNGPLFLGLA